MIESGMLSDNTAEYSNNGELMNRKHIRQMNSKAPLYVCTLNDLSEIIVQIVWANNVCVWPISSR